MKIWWIFVNIQKQDLESRKLLLDFFSQGAICMNQQSSVKDKLGLKHIIGHGQRAGHHEFQHLVCHQKCTTEKQENHATVWRRRVARVFCDCERLVFRAGYKFWSDYRTPGPL